MLKERRVSLKKKKIKNINLVGSNKCKTVQL